MPTPDPAARLAQIRARLEAATPGPWSVDLDRDMVIGHYGINGPSQDVENRLEHLADAAFIATAPSDIAWLLEVAEAAQHIQEWEQGRSVPPCRYCWAHTDFPHRADCPYAALARTLAG